MIEKKIHYVWMGKGQKPDLVLKCIKSWEKYLYDFEIIEWNEENFDIESNRFVKQAYDNKKWAFVSDYVRLFALYNYGGVYLDTDMEMLKPIDRLLDHSGFSGFESTKYIPTGIMGVQKGHPWIKELLKDYEGKTFIKDNGSLDLTPNVVNITRKTTELYGLKLNNQYQKLEDNLHIYPKEFFCPSDYGDNINQIQKKITSNSYCVHHYNGSWLSPFGKMKVKIRSFFNNNLNAIIKKRI